MASGAALCLSFLRRLFSVVISLLGLILAAPLIPIIMLAIALDSKGPVFYTQTRMGKNGALFKVEDSFEPCG